MNWQRLGQLGSHIFMGLLLTLGMSLVILALVFVWRVIL